MEVGEITYLARNLLWRGFESERGLATVRGMLSKLVKGKKKGYEINRVLMKDRNNSKCVSLWNYIHCLPIVYSWAFLPTLGWDIWRGLDIWAGWSMYLQKQHLVSSKLCSWTFDHGWLLASYLSQCHLSYPILELHLSLRKHGDFTLAPAPGLHRDSVEIRQALRSALACYLMG